MGEEKYPINYVLDGYTYGYTDDDEYDDEDYYDDDDDDED